MSSNTTLVEQNSTYAYDAFSNDEQQYGSGDIHLLLLPPDCPYPDGFGANVTSIEHPALPFEKVTVAQNNRPYTRSGIFRYLPFELLPEFGRHLNAADFAVLALVDRDFRQFSRSYQFHTLLLDYSERSRRLAEHIVKESGAGKGKAAADGGSLGQCVRRVVVSTASEQFRATYDLFPDVDDGYLDAKALARACIGYNKYMLVLSSLFSDCLPNVEVVQWKDPVAMDATLFNAITMSSSLRSLQLERFQLRQYVSPKNFQGASLSILHLNLLQCPTTSGSHQSSFAMADAIYGLLEQVATTLEELLLFNASVIPWTPPSLPRFPLLRRLALAFDVDLLRPEDPSPLPGFLSDQVQYTSPLKHLELDVLSRECITAQRRLPGLTSLVCIYPIPEDIQTIQANPQLESLILMNVMDAAVLTEQLLPRISVAPFCLTTLSLGWLGKSIDEKALRTIGTIVSLKQLWLTVGGRTDLVHDWLVDHAQMRQTLSGLTSLEDLAFSRDSYTTNARFESVGRYYSNKYFPPGTDVKALLDKEHRALKGDEAARAYGPLARDLKFKESLREAAWERWHRNRMIEEVIKYLETFSRLSFVYIGQCPLEISGRGVLGAVPTPLSGTRQRDFCCSSLRRKWGIMH